MSKIREILKGIDQQQSSSPRGWWETSEQARFGAEKLQEVDALFNELLEFAEYVASLKTGGLIESKARLAIAKARGDHE